MTSKQSIKDVEENVAKAQDTLAKVVEQLEAMKEAEAKPKGRWKPAEGESYWVVQFDTGGIFTSHWDDHRYDEARYNLGNVHQTKELAQEALDKQLAYVKITDFIAEKNAEQGWEADWGGEYQDQCRVYYNHSDECLDFILVSFAQGNEAPMFGIEETIKLLMEALRQELEQYFGV